MHKYRWLANALIFLIMLLQVGCMKVKEDAPKVVLNFWFIQEADQINSYMYQFAEEFSEENPHIEIKIKKLSPEFKEQDTELNAAAINGQVP